MAQRFRKLDPRTFRDERFRELTNAQKLVALYAIVAQSNRIGLFSFSPAMAAEDLGVPRETLEADFQAVRDALHWEWDETARVLFIPTWWKYNHPENPNVLQSCLGDLHDLPQTQLRIKFAENVRYLKPGSQAVLCETLGGTLGGTFTQAAETSSRHQEQEQEQEQKQGAGNKQDPPGAAEKSGGAVRPSRDSPNSDGQAESEPSDRGRAAAAKNASRRAARKQPGQATWLTEPSAIWDAVFGAGSFQFGRAARALAPVRDAIGDAELCCRLKRYVAHQDPQYATIGNFAEHHGQYAAGAPLKSSGGAPSKTARSLVNTAEARRVLSATKKARSVGGR